MGLKSDFDEVAAHWRQSPWRVKVFLVIALFLSSSSLASLSETVFKWKGFLLDALHFYRAWIAEPLSQIGQRILGQNLPHDFVGVAVFYGLSLGALVRALLLRRVSPITRVGDALLFGGVYVYMLYVAGHADGKNGHGGDSTIWTLYPFYVLAAITLTRGAERILALAYMVAPVLLVGIAAAVSAGLLR